MNSLRSALFAVLFSALASSSFAAEEGFVSLFNGTNLSGWGYRARAARGGSPARAAEDFAGKTASSDGRFTATDGIITVHELIAPGLVASNAPAATSPAAARAAAPGAAAGNTSATPVRGGRGGGGGRLPGQLTEIWTHQSFPKDFILRLEFRASVNADSGILLRQTQSQLQCRDYLIAGPYTELKKYKPQDWNEIEVVVTGGVARCTCNGELLEEALAVPATGGIGLEGDWGQMEYRRIRIKEL